MKQFGYLLFYNNTHTFNWDLLLPIGLCFHSPQTSDTVNGVEQLNSNCVSKECKEQMTETSQPTKMFFKKNGCFGQTCDFSGISRCRVGLGEWAAGWTD